MRSTLGACLAITLGTGIALVSTGSLPAATKSKKKKTAPPAQVSQATKTAAAARVDGYLAASEELGFEQPQGMAAFYQRLLQNTSPDSLASTHILHFGDSHTAADEWTGALRFQFQQKFGNGGSGYQFSGHPFAGYRRFGTRHGATPGWEAEGMRSGDGDGFFGLGGVSVSTRRASQSLFVEADCSLVEIYFLQQSGGGDLSLYDNDQLVQNFSTDGEVGPGMFSHRTTPGTHIFKLVTLQNRPVRLTGWATDRDAGLTYESLGINGAEASLMLRWNETMFGAYLKHRDPALIVLAYGANEASDPRWNDQAYQAMFSALLKRLRSTCPTASILVLGPTDRAQRKKNGAIVPVDGVDRVILAQRLACSENGVTYWNAKQRMGGPGSIRDWALASLGQADFTHFTAPGYDKLGETLFADLMGLYDQYLKVHIPVSTQSSNGNPSQSN